MLPLVLSSSDGQPLRVLAIGCHPDDIEIGCGGTLLALTRQRGVNVHWVVLSAHDVRAVEARASMDAFMESAVDGDLRTYEFRDGHLPYEGSAVKDVFESLKEIEPDLVFTHARSDLHQDHRLAAELTWNTFRDHLILEYEIPKYDGDLLAPNVFVPLERSVVDDKVQLLRRHFASQAGKHWFDEELFVGLMRMRGVEAATQYAEAFTCRKLRLGLQ